MSVAYTVIVDGVPHEVVLLVHNEKIRYAMQADVLLAKVERARDRLQAALTDPRLHFPALQRAIGERLVTTAGCCTADVRAGRLDEAYAIVKYASIILETCLKS